MYLDLFFEDDPIAADPENPAGKRVEGNGPGEIYAMATIGSGSDLVYHAQCTIAQYKSMISEDPKLAKTASKLASKVFKKLDKLSGKNEDSPKHEFGTGSGIIDLDLKIKIKADKDNEILTDEEIAEILYEPPIVEVTP